MCWKRLCIAPPSSNGHVGRHCRHCRRREFNARSKRCRDVGELRVLQLWPHLRDSAGHLLRPVLHLPCVHQWNHSQLHRPAWCTQQHQPAEPPGSSCAEWLVTFLRQTAGFGMPMWEVLLIWSTAWWRPWGNLLLLRLCLQSVQMSHGSHGVPMWVFGRLMPFHQSAKQWCKCGQEPLTTAELEKKRHSK